MNIFKENTESSTDKNDKLLRQIEIYCKENNIVEYAHLVRVSRQFEGWHKCVSTHTIHLCAYMNSLKYRYRTKTLHITYQVLHVRKIKTEVGLLNVAKHNDRSAYAEKDRPVWQSEHYDKTLEILPSNDVLLDRKNRIKSANLLRKPQKNASVAVEFFVSASKKFFLKHKKWSDYFSDSIKFFEKKFGKENLIQRAIHTDKSTPHMHLIFVPIVKTEKGNKYTSSEYLGGRVGMQKMHTEFYEAVGKKYGLER